MLGRLSTFFVLFLVMAWAAPADAQVYKYRKKNGAVVYTDSLAQLPPARRAYYNKLLRDREARQKKIEKAVGKETVDKERMEKERAALLSAKIEEEDRQRRIAAIDAQLDRIRTRRAAKKASRKSWSDRISTTKKALKKALAEFRDAEKKYSAVAIKGGYGLLPGEAAKMKKAKTAMDALEKDIDTANEELTVKIPEEARRAGVPPGWLR